MNQHASGSRITRRDLLLQIADLARGKSVATSQLSFDIAQLGSAEFPSSTQLTGISAGLPEMNAAERVRAELEVLGLDVSGHIMDFYTDCLTALNVVKSRDLLRCRSKETIFIAGVKVATQMPPVRSGKRVVFLTLDDSTGPLDATFFEDAQGPFAHDLFNSWILLVRGVTRRTGPRGISLRATGCWDLGVIRKLWIDGGLPAANAHVLAHPIPDTDTTGKRVALVHASGFRQSPYSNISTSNPPAKLWHRSPGTPGW